MSKKPSKIKPNLKLISVLLIMIVIFSVVVWYLIPFFKNDGKYHNPLITSIVFGEINPGQTKTLGDLRIRFWTEHTIITSNETIELYWKFYDKYGRLISMDESVHRDLMHVYIIRNDLSGDILHLHPERPINKRTLKIIAKFPFGGFWYLTAQTSKNGVTYQINSLLEVEGQKSNLFYPNFSLDKELRLWNVNLKTIPENIKVNGPIQLIFNVKPKPDTDTPKLEGFILDSGHNVIFVRQHDPFMWNIHGDTSLETISAQVGLEVKRLPIDRYPFAYNVTFTEPGIWLIHFEIRNKPVHFFIEVTE